MSNRFSYWEKASFFNYDVIVIGSGIVGLNSAIHLKKSVPFLKVAVLESGFMPAGASTKNAGFACFGSISELIEQEKTTGTNGLANLIEKRWKGLLKLRRLLGDNTIDYQCLGGYELFKDAENNLAQKCVSKIEHYNQLIQDIVGPYAFGLINEKISSFGFDGIDNLIVNKYEAQIDTGKMMFALSQYAQHIGITILNNCKVEKIYNDQKSVILETNQTHFKCDKLILATNAFIGSFFNNLGIKPGRGQVLITKPIKDLKIKGTFHYNRGYYYFRNIHNRILLGGGRNLDFESETTTELGETEIVQEALEMLLETIILPKTDFAIDMRWSGIMAFGKQLEPLTKQVEPNIFIATRCNGMGIAIGSQTGEDVAELVLKVL